MSAEWVSSDPLNSNGFLIFRKTVIMALLPEYQELLSQLVDFIFMRSQLWLSTDKIEEKKKVVKNGSVMNQKGL